MSGAGTKTHAAACAILVALCLAVYAQVRAFDFVNYDDDVYLIDNTRIRDGLTPENVAWALTTFHHSNWHPLTWLSYLIDVELFSFNPAAFHMTNAFIHMSNVLLLYFFLAALTALRVRALLVAALFAVHPLHVESVAWISERKDVLCGFFWLLASLAYIGFAKRPGPVRYLAVAVLIACALMAKPMAVTLPCVFLLLDCWPLRRLDEGSARGRVVLEKIPLFAMSAGAAVLTVFAQARGGAVRDTEFVSIGTRLANSLVAYFTYMAKTVWPADLAFFYPYPVGGLDPLHVAVAALAVVALTVIAFLGRKPRPWFFIGWCWFVGTLVPVIGIVQVGSHALADRYTYIPSIGLFIMFVWFAGEWAQGRRARVRAVAVLAVLFVAACTGAANRQARTWRSAESLYRYALTVDPNNFLAHNNLGVVLRDTDRDTAVQAFEEALRISPNFVEAYLNLGAIYLEQREPGKAIALYERALAVNADNVDVHFNLGRASSMKGDIERAIDSYERAIELDPQRAIAYSNLANVLARSGRFGEAEPYYVEALRIDPDNPITHLNMASCLLETGRIDGSIEHLEIALRLDPSLGPAREMLEALDPSR